MFHHEKRVPSALIELENVIPVNNLLVKAGYLKPVSTDKLADNPSISSEIGTFQVKKASQAETQNMD